MSEELNLDTVGDISTQGSDKLQGWIFASQSAHGISTQFRSIVGEIFNAAESVTQKAMPNSGRVKAMRVNIPVNTAATALTLELRRNGAAILTIVVAGLFTGIREVFTTVELAKDDLINYRIVGTANSTVIIPQIQLEIDKI